MTMAVNREQYKMQEKMRNHIVSAVDIARALKNADNIPPAYHESMVEVEMSLTVAFRISGKAISTVKVELLDNG